MTRESPRSAVDHRSLAFDDRTLRGFVRGGDGGRFGWWCWSVWRWTSDVGHFKRVASTVSTGRSEIARVVPTASSNGGYFDNRSTKEDRPQRRPESPAGIPARNGQACVRTRCVGRAFGNGARAERQSGIQMARFVSSRRIRSSGLSSREGRRADYRDCTVGADVKYHPELQEKLQFLPSDSHAFLLSHGSMLPLLDIFGWIFIRNSRA